MEIVANKKAPRSEVWRPRAWG